MNTRIQKDEYINIEGLTHGLIHEYRRINEWMNTLI